MEQSKVPIRFIIKYFSHYNKLKQFTTTLETEYNPN